MSAAGERNRRTCWAASTGPCSGGMSAEHYLTEALFDNDEVTLSGPSFLRGAKKKLPTSALTTNSLCRHHNSKMSPIDEAAVEFKNALVETNRLITTRRRIARLWTNRTIFASGVGFERWMLKTMMNVAHVLHEEVGPWPDRDRVARIICGNEPLPPGAGLASLSRIGEFLLLGERYQMGLLHDKKRGGPAAIILWFWGWQFVCTPIRPVTDLLPIVFQGERYDSVQHHIRRINQGDVNVSIELRW